jgi:hypothetical protein
MLPMAGFGWVLNTFRLMTNPSDFEMDDIARRRRQVAVATSVAIASACIQLSVLLMPKDAKAVWSSEETTAFVNYLHENLAKAGDGGNFKPTTFTSAAGAIAPLLKLGPQKTDKMCKTKWLSVSDFSHLATTQLN